MSACTSAGASTAAAEEDCFLGLDLWDTDPALTWIEDGRVWVRTGDLQACLSHTEATELAWGPDGRRLLLDGDLYQAGRATALATVPQAEQIVWQQPFGNAIYAIQGDGDVVRAGGDASVAMSGSVELMASHPDGEHFAIVDKSGRVSLIAGDTGVGEELMQLEVGESPGQVEFAPDGSRLWLLTATAASSNVRYVDLLPISSRLEIEPVESIVPGMTLPVPELYFIDVDLSEPLPELATGFGATGTNVAEFVLHPAHRQWVAVTEGHCTDAVSSLFVDGEATDSGLPGSVVGFFRGGGLPVLATSSAGGDCGVGQLWVVDGLPGNATAKLVSANVSSADIRQEAPDPWNPDTAPPFA